MASSQEILFTLQETKSTEEIVTDRKTPVCKLIINNVYIVLNHKVVKIS